MNRRFCFGCKHFEFDPGMRDWSEITPGYAAGIACQMKGWRFSLNNLEREDYREIIAHAVDCEDYEWNPEITEIFKEQKKINAERAAEADIAA